MEVICFTSSAGEWRSMRRLWMRISKRSQVFVPSPHGDLRVVTRSFLVGMRTGPCTWRDLSLALEMSAPHTLSRDLQFVDVSVMRILWRRSSSAAPIALPSIGFDMVAGDDDKEG